MSAAHNAAPAPPSDSPAEAQGRRVLSTAFVRLGAGDHLSVELRNGRAVVLRDVVMRRSDYCGLQVTNGAPPARFCGGYADVAAARPISAPARDAPDPVAAREGESRAGDRMHGPSSRD